MTDVKPTDYDRALADAYAAHRATHPGVLARLTEGLDASSRVLEVGCGTGHYIQTLRARLSCACFGVDPSASMLAKIRDANVHAREGRAEQLPFEDHTFDLVYSVDVIHHVRDRRAAFAEATRVLREAGRVCVVTDSESDIRGRVLAKYFPETIDVELARYPAIATLEAEMTAAGFQDVVVEGTSHEIEVADASAVKAKVFSSLLYIDDAAFARGLERLEAVLGRGPIRAAARYTLVWGS